MREFFGYAVVVSLAANGAFDAVGTKNMNWRYEHPPLEEADRGIFWQANMHFSTQLDKSNNASLMEETKKKQVQNYIATWIAI